MVGPKKQDFLPKINILKGNHFTLRLQGAPVRQKLKLEKYFFLQKMVS